MLFLDDFLLPPEKMVSGFFCSSVSEKVSFVISPFLRVWGAPLTGPSFLCLRLEVLPLMFSFSPPRRERPLSSFSTVMIFSLFSLAWEVLLIFFDRRPPGGVFFPNEIIPPFPYLVGGYGLSSPLNLSLAPEAVFLPPTA